MQADLTLQAYHYHLPAENIAQHPADQRDSSQLLVLDRATGNMEHRRFTDIGSIITKGDLLVINNTKVFPARLTGRKETGGKVEVFLLDYPRPLPADKVTGRSCFAVEALIKSSRKPQPGSSIYINDECQCIVVENKGRGKWSVQFSINPGSDLENIINTNGDIPLPPYINRPTGTTPDDANRYQTVYANRIGAVAAPTAGLHFTDSLMEKLRSGGIGFTPITLHVGYGTFSPVQAQNINDHQIHREYIEISQQSADIINKTRKEGGKIWAVGTTSVRALEFAADINGFILPFSGWCDLYIVPGFNFKVVNSLITNFHLPQSSLMFLVSALCGREKLLDCYHTAIRHDYRFFSYGDAMAII